MNKIFLLLFCGLFFSCEKKSSKFGNLTENDIEIYNLVLKEQIGSEKQMRHILNFYTNLSAPYFEDTIKMENNYLNKIEQNISNIDTCKLHVFISETIKYSNKDFEIFTSLTKESFGDNFQNVPNQFFEIIQKLNDLTQKEKIDVEIFSNNNFYQVHNANQISKIINEECIIGIFSFSDIVYDLNNSIACLYGELICGGECGSGQLFFLKYENDKWKVIARKTMWIS